MKNKALSDIEQAVETYITGECGISYTVFYTGLQKRDDWECDGWRFNINSQSFDYFTGLGHRVDTPETLQARRQLRNTNRRSIAWLQGVENKMQPARPPIAGLLHSLILDGSACNESFAEWCDSFGYDTDSRKALKTYEQCQENFDKLCKVLSSGQIEHVRKMLEDY